MEKQQGKPIQVKDIEVDVKSLNPPRIPPKLKGIPNYLRKEVLDYDAWGPSQQRERPIRKQMSAKSGKKELYSPFLGL